ncbi:MAG: DNA mismatch repair protein MutS [Syntrophaceae bacterium PtaU1.Bin231]|nr:MAG: DNA mismatch repair protein MutS [Syntrophaceae bacterium PtaU1.Bin231]
MKMFEMRRTAQRLLDYLQGFRTREDAYALAEREEKRPEDRGKAGEADFGKVLSNRDAFKDLNIGCIMDRVFEAVPRGLEKSKMNDRQFLENLFRYPVNDPGEIAERQEAIAELQGNEDLWTQVLAVKTSLDDCLYDERFSSSVYGLKSLQDAGNLVAFVSSIRRMQLPASVRLKRVRDLGARFDADEGFRDTERFIRELYIPYELGETIDGNTGFLRSITGVESRREFFNGNRLILEVTERLLVEEAFRHFINDEARAVELLATMESKFGSWHRELFGFKLSGFDLDKWGKSERRKYLDLMEYWLSLVNEAVYSRIPRLEVGDLAQELGFFLGAAALQREWAKGGIPVVNPTLVDKRERRAAILGSFNPSLITTLGGNRVVPNDILSDRDHNIFVITGPNNGGKTTYIRQVGQMYWLAHLGMGVPADRAELSLVDSLFTSFNAEDNTAEGTGLYLTELKRISQFTRPEPGQPRMTPYSVIFFDEFANGTDHQESVRRTRTILEHLSRKGVTAYFTTHKHEIADIVARGDLAGAVNLAAEVRHRNGGIETTYRIVRDAREMSYGHLQAEAMGITPESLQALLVEEVSQGLYPREDTRLGRMEETRKAGERGGS